MKLTQRDRIMRHLKDYGSITGKEAVNEYGIMHLASRISEMKKDGIPISSVIETSKNRYGELSSYKRYSLDC